MAEARCWHGNQDERGWRRGSGMQIEVNKGGGGFLSFKSR
jgi:hypothetical protein